jgi:hypothetical protein
MSPVRAPTTVLLSGGLWIKHFRAFMTSLANGDRKLANPGT